MVDKEQFQELGEAWRQNLGIDGTAGDAQDEPHPFIPASPGGPCVVCGLAESWRKHTAEALALIHDHVEAGDE
jgi:hypothetical protein